MNKIVKIVLWGTLGWWFAFFIVFVITTTVPEIAFQLRELEKIIPAVVYVILSFFAFFMMFRMIKKMRENPSIISDTLFGFFLLSGASALIQGLFGIIEFTERDLQVFFTDSTYLSVAGSTFMMGFFIIELFWKGLDVKRNIYILLGVGFITLISFVGISLNIILDLDDWVLYVPTAFLFVTTIAVYLVLIISSFKIRKYLDKSAEKRSLLRIGLSGVFMVLGFFMVLTYIIMSDWYIRIANAILLMIGYYLLFRGFTQRIKKE